MTRAVAAEGAARGAVEEPPRANLTSHHIVTTHDPFLPDLVPPASLFVVERTKRTNYRTSIVPRLETVETQPQPA